MTAFSTDIENVTVNLAEYQEHPSNYNEHPEAQVLELMESLRQFGQPKSIVVWRDKIIAGNGIAIAARRLGWQQLAGRRVPEDWPEYKVKAYLGADNELARGASPNLQALAGLAAEVRQQDETLARLAAGGDDALRALMANLAAPADGEGDDSEGGANDEAPFDGWDVPDALFASDNDMGIPLLSLDMQAQVLVAPVQPWGMGAGARSRQNPGTWHFYTEDYRFEALWGDPSPVVKSGCAAVVEPNFSAYLEMPRAVALWSIYRKRWLARWWQVMGLRVLVDLNVAEPHYEDNLLGVPVGWKAWATRGYSDRLNLTDLEYEMACQRAGTRDILFFVYGGGKAVRERCQERGWTHVIEQRDAAKVEVKDGER